MANPTLRSDVVSALRKHDTSIRYDIDYLSEAETKTRPVFGQRQILFPTPDKVLGEMIVFLGQ